MVGWKDKSYIRIHCNNQHYNSKDIHKLKARLVYILIHYNLYSIL